MCLAIPAKVAALEEGNLATVDILGVTREISVDLTPQVQVGDYVLVHAGFAIQRVEEQDAHETLRLLAELPDLFGDEFAGELAAASAAPAADGR